MKNLKIYILGGQIQKSWKSPFLLSLIVSKFIPSHFPSLVISFPWWGGGVEGGGAEEPPHIWGGSQFLHSSGFATPFSHYSQVCLTLSCFLMKVNSLTFLNFSLNPMWRPPPAIDVIWTFKTLLQPPAWRPVPYRLHFFHSGKLQPVRECVDGSTVSCREKYSGSDGLFTESGGRGVHEAEGRGHQSCINFFYFPGQLLFLPEQLWWENQPNPTS